MNLQLETPFSWALRLSHRASRPRITISAYGKVELVWPVNMGQKDVPLILRQHQQWVVHHLEKMNYIKADIKPPEVIAFEAVAKLWHIKYVPQQSERLNITADTPFLHIRGEINNQIALRKSLTDWVKLQGRLHLKPWLEAIAAEMDVSYQSLSIRLQKKRWGSCSASKQISLNAALLFLPPFLVRHVLIHELSHLKHLNHSAHFWNHVKCYDPNYLENRSLLRQSAHSVPAWLTEPFMEPDCTGP